MPSIFSGPETFYELLLVKQILGVTNISVD